MGFDASQSVRRKRIQSKGIFCLEGDWWGSLYRESSVRPALELLKQWDPYYIPFVHRDIGTRSEFDYYLNKWTQSGGSKFPILYLAFHASPETLYFGDKRKTENQVTLDELEYALCGKCYNRIIHLGGCGSIDTHGKRLNRFLDRTRASAVCGYRGDIDWLLSAAFEIIVFGSMQLYSFSKSGAEAIQRRIERDAGTLIDELGFRMVVKK